MTKKQHETLRTHYKLAKQLSDEIENIEKLIRGLKFRLKDNRTVQIGVSAHVMDGEFPKQGDFGCYVKISPDIARRTLLGSLKPALENLKLAYRKLPPLP
jgi:hypothetical protein